MWSELSDVTVRNIISEALGAVPGPPPSQENAQSNQVPAASPDKSSDSSYTIVMQTPSGQVQTSPSQTPEQQSVGAAKSDYDFASMVNSLSIV